MNRTILLDIDTQADFCNADGALYVPGADGARTRAAMAKALAWARGAGVAHVATADEHRWGDAEITDTPDWETTFPPHCMAGTPGALFIPETEQDAPLRLHPEGHVAALAGEGIGAEFFIPKTSVSCFDNPATDALLERLQVRRVFLFGVATDICVAAAWRALRERDIPVVVIADACAGIDQDKVAETHAGWDADPHTTVMESGALAG